MRVFAVSDIHVDFDENARWLADLSSGEYRDDVLILAGDVSDFIARLEWTLGLLAARFRRVLFVPGNHELWVTRDVSVKRYTSLEKFEHIRTVVERSGASMQPQVIDRVLIVPLLGWYDYSFGSPGTKLLEGWMDYHACQWPAHFQVQDVAAHFQALNRPPPRHEGMRISFSHFLPRIDVMPTYIPQEKRFLYPVLGSTKLEEQIRALGSRIHVYGHSHVNRQIEIDGVTYINNAFGYPEETRIAAKQLLCIYSN